jgi:ankyrin repeat protein
VLLAPLLEAAVARVCPSGDAILARRTREVVRPAPRGTLGGHDLSCRVAVACWRYIHAVGDGSAGASSSSSSSGRFADARQLAHALLSAAAGDALGALVADACVAADGTLLFTSRAAAAAAAASGALRCVACGRGFPGRRALRNHAQDAHAASYAQSIAAVSSASSAARQLRLTAQPPGDTSVGSSSATVLHPGLAAARDGDVAALRALVSSGWDACTCVDRHGSSALLWAAGGGHLDACVFLVTEAGCDAAASRQLRDGRSPLLWAARNGHLPVVRWLVDDAGAPAGDATHDGTPALHWALWQGHLHVCDFLAARGAACAGVNGYGCGAAHWLALRDGNAPAACDWLLARTTEDAAGTLWRSANAAGHAPLHKAAARGNVDVAAWLLAHAGAGGTQHLDAADADGNTPLALAALWGQAAMAQLLLDAGAQLEAMGPVRFVCACFCLLCWFAFVVGERRGVHACRAVRRRWRGP